MTFTNSTKNQHQRRIDQREVHSRPKGVNQSRPSRTLLNHRLQRIHQKTRSHPKVLQEMVRDQWENKIKPQWFITFLWNNLPTRSETSISHSRHFRNVFLTSMLNKPLKKLPEPPSRSGVLPWTRSCDPQRSSDSCVPYPSPSGCSTWPSEPPLVFRPPDSPEGLSKGPETPQDHLRGE